MQNGFYNVSKPKTKTTTSASYALSSSYSNSAVSSSYALSSSHSDTSVSASYVNPLNQLVIITGSLIQGQAGNVASGIYSHAEGSSTIASGDYSHAEGFNSLASGLVSHAEGFYTTASGDYSHAEGAITKALGSYSHAEGASTTASGDYSHTEGLFTVAQGNFQHVQGQYNISSSVQSAFIVGNGTDNNNRRNLIYAAGTQVEITGSLTVSSSNTTQLQIGSNLLFVSSSGRVGIGTTTPAYNLQILDTTSGIPQQLDIKNSTANSRAAFSLTNDANNSLFMQLGGSNYAAPALRNVAAIASAGASIDSLWIATNWESATGGTVPIKFVAGGYNNSSSLTITSGNPGNVGIGTSTPNARLDVNGSTIITGSFTVTTGSNVELQVLNTGVRLGNIITDAHTVTGSLSVSGSATLNGNIIITGSANNSLLVRGSGATSATSTVLTQNSSGTTTFTVRDDGKVVVGSNSATTAPGRLTIFQGSSNATDGINFQLASNDANQLNVGAIATNTIQISSNGAGWNFAGTGLRNTLAASNFFGTFAMTPNGGAACGGIDVQGSLTDLGLTGGFGVAAAAGGNSYNDRISMTLTTAGNGNAPGQSATLYCGRTYLISGSRNDISSIVLNSTFNQIQAISTGSITGINHIPVITSAYNYRAFDFSNTTAYTPNAAMTNYVWSRISANISASVNSQQITGLDITLSGSNVAFTGVRRSALRLSTQNITDSALTAIGGVVVTGSLNVAGTTRLSGSFNTAASGSVLTIIGSGSAQPIFTVQGSQGELFSVTDSLSGSLFSVNDISGLPIMEVFSDNTILMGDYQDPMMLTTKKIVQTNSGSFIVYSIPTSSYDGAFIDYTIKSGSNARAGTIMSTWAGSSIEFTEVDTMDIGSTTAVGLTMIVSGANAVLTGSSTTGAWTIRTIIRTI